MALAILERGSRPVERLKVISRTICWDTKKMAVAEIWHLVVFEIDQYVHVTGSGVKP